MARTRVDKRDTNPLKMWRLRNSLSQREAAKRLTVTVNTLVNWEQGLHRPTPRGFATLNDVCGITQVQWLTWADSTGSR